MTELLVVGTAVLVLDQLSKSAITAQRFPLGGLVHPVPTTRARFRNPAGRMWYTFYLALAVIVSVVLTREGAVFNGALSAAGMGAALGGAAGNLLDMFRHRAVRDFIDFGWWPRFNLADVAIVAGLSAAFLGAPR